jgi:ATP-dependent DNA helicase DinG
MARALIRVGMHGAKHSHSGSYGEHLQRRKPPRIKDARRARDLFSVA